MADTYILGAGASFSYDDSPTGLLPPLANGFFTTYCGLDISGDIQVRVGDIVNYVRDEYGIQPEHFCEFAENVEPFMTKLDEYVRKQTEAIANNKVAVEEFGELVNRVRAHDQMVFLFAHVLNEIQNGPLARDYIKLVGKISDNDTLVTFNWDTLLDRVLHECTDWNPDTGYGVQFRNVLDRNWRKQQDQKVARAIKYLKLHGSTNWLVHYMTWHLSSGKRIMLKLQTPRHGFKKVSLDPKFLESIVAGKYFAPEIKEMEWGEIAPPGPDDPEGYPNLFIDGSKGFESYKDRFRGGYEPYSYFFPPNDPETHIPLMPLMVPPTQYKLYEEFAHIIDPLWELALESLSNSKNVFLIGYSLPQTDTRSLEMFRDADLAGRPNWFVVNPYPDSIIERLVKEVGIDQNRIHVEAATLREFLAK
jgi:hypothetical protein